LYFNMIGLINRNNKHLKGHIMAFKHILYQYFVLINSYFNGYNWFVNKLYE